MRTCEVFLVSRAIVFTPHPLTNPPPPPVGAVMLWKTAVKPRRFQIGQLRRTI